MKYNDKFKFALLISVIVFFSFITAGAAQEIPNKIWKPVPLRTLKQKDAGMPGGEGMNMVFHISYAPSNSDVAYFVADQSGVWKGEWDGSIGLDWDGDGWPDGSFFWKSKRGGDNLGYRSRGGISLSVDPSNENIVFVSSSNHSGSGIVSDIDGIYRTMDGGDTWENLFVTTYLREFNGGISWEGQHFVFDNYNMPENRYKTIYAATHEDGLLRSIDGGDSWSLLTEVNGAYNFMDVSCIDSGLCGNRFLEGKRIFDIEMAETTGLLRMDWYNLNWQYRQRITVDSDAMIDDAGAGDLVDFPLLIKLTAPGNHLFAHVQSDGDDILFTTLDGEKIDHEIETWDPAGEMTVWVRIPVLYSTGDTAIHMYYGNQAASNQQNPDGVWDENYVMVQHLNETYGQHHIDSTINNNDSTIEDVAGQGTDGVIGGADKFNGTDNFIIIPDSGSLDILGQLTLEAWINPASWEMSVMGSIIHKLDGGADRPGYRFHIDASGNCRDAGNPSLASFYGTLGWACSNDLLNILTLNAWHHVSLVYSSTSIDFYVDSIPSGSVPLSQPPSNTANARDLIIGAWTSSGGASFDGYIDEVRISDTARSREWITASYNNQNSASTYITYESPETNNITANRTGIILYLAAEDGLRRVSIHDTGGISVQELGDFADLRTIALDSQNNDIIYALSAFSGVYKSYDGGQTFYAKNNGLPDSAVSGEYKIIDTSVNHPGYLHLMIPYNANVASFHSSDGGEKWDKTINRDLGSLSLRAGRAAGNASVNPDDPLRAIRVFGATDRIAETRDGGTTWRYANNGYMGGAMIGDSTAFFGPETAPGDRRIIYFLWDEGPALSEDNGGTWRFLMRNASYPKTTHVGVVLNNGRIISAKGKHDWQCIAVSDNVFDGSSDENWTIYSNLNPECGDINSQGNQSDPQGNNYIDTRVDENFQFMSAHDTGTEYYVYAGGKNGSWISRDGGDTWGSWDEVTGEWRENIKLANKGIRAVFPGDSNIVYAFQQCSQPPDCVSNPPSSCIEKGGQALLWRSVDAGVSWSAVNCIHTGIPQMGEIEISPDDSNRLYVAASDGFYIFDECDGDPVTEDPDCTPSGWVKKGNADGIEAEEYNGGQYSPETKLRSVAVDQNNPDIVYAGLWSAYGQRKEFIYRSTDKGNTWGPIRYNLEGYENIASIIADPQVRYRPDGSPYSILHMSTTHGNYVLCLDEDGDGYTTEGGPCGPVDIADNDPAMYRIEDLLAKDQNMKIKLQWTCAPGTGTYNIYRGSTQGGPYEQIAAGHQTDECNYFDEDELVNGQTYYYVVRWVDTSGHETADSNEAVGTH